MELMDLGQSMVRCTGVDTEKNFPGGEGSFLKRTPITG